MGRVISTAIQFVDGFTRPSREVINSMRAMGNEAIKAGKQIQNAGKTITSIGSTLTTTITLPIVGIATAAVKTAADFESAMSEVGAISGASAADMEILTKKAKEMGAATSFSASESADAMKYMGMAGWKAADMVDGIAGIMNLAAASGEELGTTSDIVTDGLTAFGLAAKDSGRFADVMAAASTNANTNVSLMGESFKYCAATAGAMGYSIEDISVAIGTMANAGIKGSTAGTTIKNIISNMAKPTDAQAEAMKKLGVSLTDSSGNMKSFGEVMNDFRTSFSGLTETQKAQYATTIAGKESMSGLLTIVNASSADFEKLSAAINGASGTAEEMAAKMLDNLKGQLTLLKSALEGIAITIGDKLMPYIKQAVTWFQKAADYINNLSDAQVSSIIKWAAMAATIGPAIMVFGKVITTIGKVQSTFGKVTKVIANFGGITGLITSPAGIVIGVLAAIALAAFLIIKNWDQVKIFLSNVGAWFKNAFEKAGFSVEDFGNKFTTIGNVVGNIANKIGGFCKNIASIFKREFAGSIAEGINDANGGFEEFVGSTALGFDGIVAAVGKGLQSFELLLDFFSGAFMGNWDNAAQGFRDSLKNIFPDDIADIAISAFDSALPAIKAVVEGIKSSFLGFVQDARVIFDSFKSIFGGIGTFLKGIFTGDAETAMKGFETAVNGVLDTVGNIFKARLNVIKNFIIGALSTFMPEETVNKIAGVFDTVARAWDTGISTAKNYVRNFTQAIKPLFDNIKTIMNGVSQFIKGVFTGDWKGALNGLKTIASGALSGLLNIIKAPFTAIKSTVKEAVSTFKIFGIIKNIFNGIGSAIKNVLTKSGVDIAKLGTNANNIKTRISSILNNLKIIFSTVFGVIGRVIRAAAGVIANAFGKKVSDTFSTAKVVITAFKAVAGAAFGIIALLIKQAMAVIVPVVKVAFSAIKGAISAAVSNIMAIVSGLITILDGIITFISGVFTGNWSKAWGGIKTIFKGVFDSLAALCKTPINAVIGIINGAISGINNLGLTIPDWVPKIGGKSFSINVPTIPMLYKGTNNWQGGTAMIHDRGGEIVDLPKGSRVYPHDKSVDMARREGAASAGGSGGINITIQKLADKIEVRSDQDIDRIAEALALKLQKVALNTGRA